LDTASIVNSIISAPELAATGGFLFRSLSIILIDIILSGDNSVVIAMAVYSLPKEKRIQGILLGASGAVALRILLTLIASHLLDIPFLKSLGGALILWIAVKLLLEESQAAESGQKIESLWIILIADFTMSLDNVLAVAAASRGNVLQLWLSLGFSIPLVIFTSTLLSKLLDKYSFILLIGAALLGKVGGEMIFTDPILQNWFGLEANWLKWTFEAFCAAGVLLLSTWIKSRYLKGSKAAEP
jgi:YjbE family integral membrane protein